MLAGKRRCLLLPFHSFICGDTHSFLHAKRTDISHVSYIMLVIRKPDRTALASLCNSDVEMWKDYFSGCSRTEDLPAAYTCLMAVCCSSYRLFQFLAGVLLVATVTNCVPPDNCHLSVEELCNALLLCLKKGPSSPQTE